MAEPEKSGKLYSKPISPFNTPRLKPPRIELIKEIIFNVMPEN